MSSRPLSAPARSPRGRALGSAVGRVLLVAAVAGAIGATAGAHPLLLLAGGLAASAALAMFVRPDTATLLVVFVLYTNAAIVGVTFHGLPSSVAAVVPMLLIAPLGYHLLNGRDFILPSPAGWILLLLFVQILSTLFSPGRETAAGEVQTFIVEGLALFVLIVNTVRDWQILRQVVWTLLLAGVVLSTLSILQVVLDAYDNDFLGFAQVSETRLDKAGSDKTVQIAVEGPIGSHGRYAQMLLVLVPLGLFLFLSERRASARVIAAAATSTVAFAILLTLSRGAAVGFAALVVAMAMMRYVSLKRVALLLVATMALLLAVPQYRERVSTLGLVPSLLSEKGTIAGDRPDTSLQSRATEGLIAMLMFTDHPVLGVGPGVYKEQYLSYRDRAGAFADDLAVRVKASDREAHSLYLGLLAETGIAGFLAFLAVVIVAARNLVRARRRCLGVRPEVAHLTAGFVLALVAYLATAIFLHLAFIRYFWLLVGLAAAAALIAETEARASRSKLPGEAPTPT